MMKGYALHIELEVLCDLRDLRGFNPSCASCPLWIKTDPQPPTTDPHLMFYVLCSMFFRAVDQQP